MLREIFRKITHTIELAIKLKFIINKTRIFHLSVFSELVA